MKRTVQTLGLVLALALPLSARAQEGGEAAIPEEARPAAQVLTQYLDAVKGKKWAEAKKLTHPRTVAAIAERKKRLGDENHPMAPWFYEKTQWWLKDYRVTEAKPGPEGTWIFESVEDNFQVEEKGISEGDQATYLVGRTGGRWLVVDKKRGVSFTRDSIRFGYKGYFDPPQKATGSEED